jgi:hypothetical protein
LTVFNNIAVVRLEFRGVEVGVLLLDRRCHRGLFYLYLDLFSDGVEHAGVKGLFSFFYKIVIVSKEEIVP